MCKYQMDSKRKSNSSLIILGLASCCCLFIMIMIGVLVYYYRKSPSPSPSTRPSISTSPSTRPSISTSPSTRPSTSTSPSPSTIPSTSPSPSPTSPGRTTWAPLTPFGQYNLVDSCVNINNIITCSAIKFESTTSYRFVTTDINGHIISTGPSEFGTYIVTGNRIDFITPNPTSGIMFGQSYTADSTGTILNPNAGTTLGRFVLSGAFTSPAPPPDGCSIM